VLVARIFALIECCAQPFKTNRAEMEASATGGGSAFRSHELPVEMVVINHIHYGLKMA